MLLPCLALGSDVCCFAANAAAQLTNSPVEGEPGTKRRRTLSAAYADADDDAAAAAAEADGAMTMEAVKDEEGVEQKEEPGTDVKLEEAGAPVQAERAGLPVVEQPAASCAEVQPCADDEQQQQTGGATLLDALPEGSLKVWGQHQQALLEHVAPLADAGMHSAAVQACDC